MMLGQLMTTRAVFCIAGFVVAVLALASPALAQHGHGGDSAEVETFVVEGLRVDAEKPPPGSAVGRAGARLSGGGYLHVVYGKPYTRGRQVFGGLVAFDNVWATGAHRATEFLTTVPITLGGSALAPGVYSLFTTPGKEEWTLHLNSALGMHLADEYDAELDVLTAVAKPTETAEATPGFVIEFGQGSEGIELVIRWDRTRVAFPIDVP